MFITVNYTRDMDYPLKLLVLQIILLVSTWNMLRDQLGECCRGFVSWEGRRKVGASCTSSTSPVPQAERSEVDHWSGVLIASHLWSMCTIKLFFVSAICLFYVIKKKKKIERWQYVRMYFQGMGTVFQISSNGISMNCNFPFTKRYPSSQMPSS